MARRRPRVAAKTYAIPLKTVLGRYASQCLLLLALALMLVSRVEEEAIARLRMALVDAVVPVMDAVARPVLAISDRITGMGDIRSLRAENMLLKEENERLRQWYEAALRLEVENKSLRGLLNVAPDPGVTYVTARVVSDPGGAFVRSILLPVGTGDGVRRGQAVMVEEGLIGRVIEAGARSARVLLLTDLNARVPVVIENTLQKGILAGDNSNTLSLKHLQDTSALAPGARVITSGHGGMLPAGIPVGRVTEVSEDGRTVRVAPLADLSRLYFVQVIESGLYDRIYGDGGIVVERPEENPAGRRN